MSGMSEISPSRAGTGQVRAPAAAPARPAPEALRSVVVAVLMILAPAWCLAALAPPRAATGVAAAGFDANAAERDLFDLVNQYRQQNGRAVAAWGPLASSVAQDHVGTACGLSVRGRAQDMVDRDYLSGHIPPCGEAGITLLQSLGWHGYGGEMVAAVPAGLDSPDAASHAFDQFRASYSTQLLDTGVNELGVGWAIACGGWSAGYANGFAASLFFLHDYDPPGGSGPAEPSSCPIASPSPPSPAPPAPSASTPGGASGAPPAVGGVAAPSSPAGGGGGTEPAPEPDAGATAAGAARGATASGGGPEPPPEPPGSAVQSVTPARLAFAQPGAGSGMAAGATRRPGHVSLPQAWLAVLLAAVGAPTAVAIRTSARRRRRGAR
jgi:uncharacterized protein YkwD